MKLLLTLNFLALGLAVLAQVPKSTLIVDEVKLREVSHANDEFDMRLLQELELENVGQNVFISAFSISSAMTMMMTGGVNKTYTEIHDALGFSKSKFSNNDILYGYQHLMAQLNTKSKDSGNTLSIANAIAIQKNKAILETYLNSITNYFGAQVFAEDFVLNGPKATAELNQWVSEKTHGKIPKLFDELPSSTVMVLMNAIYFKGMWDSKFEKTQTKNAPFHLTREQSAQVPFMMQSHKLNYAHFDDGELLEIPYKNQTLSMYIFLPNESRNSKQLSTLLSAQTFQQRIQMKESRDVTVHLPKFKFEGSYSLVNALSKMGIHAAFGSGADFSNINGARDLSVSGVVHKTYIDVNEEGSEAAAATGIVFETTSVHVHKPPVVLKVDRPFMFFIRDNQHQLTLFSGVINKPEYKN